MSVESGGRCTAATVTGVYMSPALVLGRDLVVKGVSLLPRRHVH